MFEIEKTSVFSEKRKENGMLGTEETANLPVHKGGLWGNDFSVEVSREDLKEY